MGTGGSNPPPSASFQGLSPSGEAFFFWCCLWREGGLLRILLMPFFCPGRGAVFLVDIVSLSYFFVEKVFFSPRKFPTMIVPRGAWWVHCDCWGTSVGRSVSCEKKILDSSFAFRRVSRKGCADKIRHSPSI